MPWRTATVEDERARFVIEAERSFFSFRELCKRHGISRKTGYKWMDRYRAEGFEGLKDRSHRPHSCPHRTPPEVERRIVELRKHRGWGAKKLGAVLERELGWSPSRDTIHRILDRHGLVKRRKPRQRRTHPGRPDGRMECPNAVWTADFKGQFRMGSGRLCYPLTVQDGHSRFLLCCKGLLRPTKTLVRPCFERLFARYGLPDRIRTDNGHPFASNALSGLSELGVWWIRLGILPERIEPGKPQQNGRHERMHRTLKAKTTRPPASNLRAQQARFDRWRKVYNKERPHEALGQQTPGEVYRSSARLLPDELELPSYPEHFEVRKVAGDRTIKWHDRKVFVSGLLRYDYVGLEEIDDGVWSVYYGPVHLGWLDERDMRIMDVWDERRRR
jgi:transposase InsO family protein